MLGILFSCTFALAAAGYAIHLMARGTKYGQQNIHQGCNYFTHKEHYRAGQKKSQGCLEISMVAH